MTRLNRLQAWACRSPISTPVETSFGRMRDRPAVFVRIEDDEGGFGWGEIFANWPAAGAEHRVNLLAEDIAPLLLGQDISAPDCIFHSLERKTHIRALQCGEFGPFRQVLAGLDQAMWDLKARRAGETVHQTLGSTRVTKVPAYASGIHISAAAKMIPQARDLGFCSFKVKVGFGDENEAMIIRDIHSGLSAGEMLMLDANQAWDVAQAEAFLNKVADLPIGWIEEPIRADSGERDWLRLAGQIPLAGGENIAGIDAFDATLNLGALDVYQPDIAKWGGFTGCLAVAGHAIARGHSYCPHFLGGGIGLAASAQLLAAAGGPGLLEVDVNPNPLRDAFGSIGTRVQDGFWLLDQAAGIGLTGLPEEVRACITHQCERTR